MRPLLSVIAAILLVLTGAALVVVVMQGSGLALQPNEEISRADFLAIILTAVAVILTAITIFLGALAFVGWATFETRVKQSSDAFLEKRFSDDDPRYMRLVNDLKEDVGRRITFEGESPKTPENESNLDESAV